MPESLFKVAVIHTGAADGRRNWERLAVDCNSRHITSNRHEQQPAEHAQRQSLCCAV